MHRIVIIAFLGVLAATGAMAQSMGVSLSGISQSTGEPLEIQSDAFTIAQDPGAAFFTGSVVISQGALSMSADRVAIEFLDAQGISNIVATGEVTLDTPAEHLSAQMLEYSLTRDIITLTGDVVFVAGTTRVTADAMSIDLSENTGTLNGNVRAMLTPTTPSEATNQ